MAFDITNLLKHCDPDPMKAGKTLLTLNALGMVFAAASNTFAVATDKNTKPEDKSILVPAGVATGIANIGLYYGMTTKIIDKLAGKKIKASGEQLKNITKKLKEGSFEYLEEDGKKIGVEIKGVAHKLLDKWKAEGTFNASVKSFTDANIKAEEKAAKPKFFGLFKGNSKLVEDAKAVLLKDGKPSEKAINDFTQNTKAGLGVLGAFIGAVVGCAILTPIFRDISSYFVQKKLEKNKPELKEKPYIPYIDPIHVGMKKQPLSMKSYMTFTNGSMRI